MLSRSALQKRLRSFWGAGDLRQVLLAMFIGVVAGFGAILFRYLIGFAEKGFFEGGKLALPFLGDAYVIVLPAIGLVIVTAMVRKWAPEAQGHGVPEVMYAVKKEGGRIRPRVAGIKALASSICIGAGGSVGREGPIVQIGCTIGSSMGQFLGLKDRQVRLLLACGGAAGVAGTFNAPIAGVIFALEVLLGSFAARSFGLVVISSVSSTAIVQAVLGPETAFPLTEIFSLKTPLELPLYLVLGIVTGVVALLFVQFLYFLEELFARWSWPPLVKAAIAGLAVGGLGYFASRNLGGPFLFGVGYDGIEAALALGNPEGFDLSLGGGLTITALLLLMLLKMPATALTLAGGGSGGVFAPSLFIGAMTGGAFGLLVNAVFPGMTAPVGAYALVGMGAVFAGAAHAPIASILFLFEMTDDYQIILPLMLAVVMSYLIASRLNPDSIYTIKLRRRGGLTPTDSRTSVLDQLLVADAMTTDYETVPAGETVQELAARFHGSHIRAYAVTDDEGKLVGIVTEYDVETALMAGDVAANRAEDIMTSRLITCTPVQSMRTALSTFANRDVGQIPVVDVDDPGQLVGVLRRSEIFWAYGQLAIEHRKMLLEAVMDLPDDHGDSVHVKLEVQADNEQLAFRKIRDIPVPDQTLVAVLSRGGRSIVPRGNTVVEPGDVLVLLTIRAREPSLRRWVASVAG